MIIHERDTTQAPILLVDDDPACLGMLSDVLGALGIPVETARDGKEALEMIYKGDFRIVLSDWQMPGMSGVELCRRVRQRPLSGYVYFILLTSLDRQHNLVSGLRAGADDFITKPFDPEELHIRLRAANRIVSLESRNVIIFALAKLAESRDPETGAHLERMREYSRLLADDLSRQPKYADIVDADYVRTIYLTSPLHDIGKVGIPDHVLLKPGRLTPDEFEIMKQHTLVGYYTLDAALREQPEAAYLRFARDIAGSHHEKWDGTGYPYGLAGEEIPLCGRIVAVADVYDALTTARVYKEAFSHEKARSIIREGAGKHFDPDIVDAFFNREDEIVDINQRLNDMLAYPDIAGMANGLAIPAGNLAQN
ncbi:response regulator [Bremerella cremea]|uniref:Two-component system response regulator n=1 Tax=Blastopirellula marina TaxID=124 RepID=A0A2S8G5I1_9BACT|nr:MULTISPECIES: HD domain-containing phosphohydrolase [Pirellulaceae]PQO39712.1 two-component system response regulator [Blastopirellula marina]RCS51179.1 response regulator [Bremerella cremea]